MGVPKFFRYISERYPCLSELVRENQIPQFDNLYLDMNGIIHVCSHPNDNDPHFRISEEDIFKNIAHYIEILFRMIQPQRLFFMAVDGVAPRAKMNQQRGRRFRSAREAQDLEDAARAKGEELPTEARFDSNCITPGTAFMARLQEFLKSFVKRKMNSDSNWQKCRVILSGHETPGEGEHKIMEYIRYLKASPGYDPNTRHCLYGLDADLIMLGLCSHEPHFSLLREEVKFGKHANSRNPTAEETRFYLLHLSILRDYLQQEFISLRDNLPFKYNLESIIDDWIFMGFLVGNDFIPHLPNLHISSNALPLLYDIYKEVLPTLDGYINECGELNLERLEKFMERLAAVDKMQFSDVNADLKYFAAKLTDNAWVPEHKKQNDGNSSKSKDLQALISAVDDMFLDDDSPDNFDEDSMSFDIRDKNLSNMTDEEMLEEEFNLYKRDYYINKLGYKEVTPDVLMEQAECYIRALQWTLAYYYRGVCSWGWFYPHHYAPFMSDVKNFANLDYSFDLGEPFLPFEQLLAVLPAASGALLPEPYRKLMVSSDSPILHYYPTTFETDLNGKRQEWEAVVLIPFIEEEKLLESMARQKHLLSPEEVARNIHGPMLQYDYIPGSETTFASEYPMPDLTANIPKKAPVLNITEVFRSDVYVPYEKLVLGPVPGASFSTYFPGFPSMIYISYTSRLEKGQVRVFEQMTRNDSMIIEIKNDTAKTDAATIAHRVLNQVVHVQWPHLIEAKVIAVLDENHKYYLRNGWQFDKQEHTHQSRSEFNSFRKSSKKHFFERMGIDIGDTSIILQVEQLKNYAYVFEKKGKVKLEKEWCSIPSYHPLQTCVLKLRVQNIKHKEYQSILDVFSKNQRVYLLGKPYYGSVGLVHDLDEQSGRLKIGVVNEEEPDYSELKKMHNDILKSYLNGYDSAAKLGISNYLLGRVTGTVYLMSGSKDKFDQQDTTVKKYNIGLNLKFTKKNEEVTGYSRKVGNTWLYSEQALDLIASYMEEFPEIFKLLNQSGYSDMMYESDLYPDEVGTGKLDKILEWLKAQPYNDALRKSCDSQALTTDIVREVIDITNQPRKKISVTIAVKPIHLYVPGLQPDARAPDPLAVFNLFDRVVNVRPNHTVPLGYKGTVIGVHVCRDPNPIHQNVANADQDIFLDVLFDKTFPAATGYCGMEKKDEDNHCYRMTPQALINITFGAESNTAKLLIVKGPNIPSKDKLANDNDSEASEPTIIKLTEEQVVQPNPAVASAAPENTKEPEPASNVCQNQDEAKVNSQLNDDDVKEYQFKINNDPEQRKQFWDDLLKQKSNPVAALPSSDTGTEALKQILGVVQKVQNQPIVQQSPPQQKPIEPQAQQRPSWQANPISVQDMFKHAANMVPSPVKHVLPPPPVQWYGSPQNQMNYRPMQQPQHHHHHQPQQQFRHHQMPGSSPNHQKPPPPQYNQMPVNQKQQFYQMSPNQKQQFHQMPGHSPHKHINQKMVNQQQFPNYNNIIRPPGNSLMVHKPQQQNLVVRPPNLMVQQPMVRQSFNSNVNMNVSINENQEVNRNRNAKSGLQGKAADASPSAFIPLQAVRKARVSTGSCSKGKLELSLSPAAREEALQQLEKLQLKQREIEKQFEKFCRNTSDQMQIMAGHDGQHGHASNTGQQQMNNSVNNSVQQNMKKENDASGAGGSNQPGSGNKKKPKPIRKSRVAANFGQPL